MGVEGDFQAVVLAAGKGTRMRSELPKVLHEVLGLPMISHVTRAARAAGATRVVAVLGHGIERVEAWLASSEPKGGYAVAEQREQLGTGHAVWVAADALRGGAAHTLVLYGDVPNLTAESMQDFVRDALEAQVPLAVMTAEVDDPTGYGRMLRGEDGGIAGIVEHRDATEAQRAINEINAGIYLMRTDFMLAELEKLMGEATENAQGEYYLTDLVERAAKAGGALGWVIQDHAEIQGVNTRVDLATATATARARTNEAWMRRGVTMIDPSQVLIEPDVEFGSDVILYPGVTLRGRSVIGDGVVIEPGCWVQNSTIATDAHIKANSYMDQAEVGARTAIGPMAHLRPGSSIGADCKVGNFVEVKKARLEDGAKAGHLTYLGDAHVGAGANVGAGTITCNYDGTSKHKTEIGAGAFIGSNTALVAPVSVADGAYVAAGSTITDAVPSGALAVARGRQKNIEGWVERSKKS